MKKHFRGSYLQDLLKAQNDKVDEIQKCGISKDTFQRIKDMLNWNYGVLEVTEENSKKRDKK